MKEDSFINLIKNSLPSSSSYIGDDTAFIAEKGLLLTQDTLIEDVHFRKSTISPYDLGIKSIAVNLSDIAASGGIARYILISLSLPENIEEYFVKSFYDGVRDICDRYKVIVVGGDLTRSEKITISVAVIGFSEGIKPASRSYAKKGDFVIVTGEFGSSAAGLWILESQNSNKLIPDIPDEIRERFIKAHTNPEPKLQEGRLIVETCQNPPALMDTSDGLADALFKICNQSRVSMEINYSDIPINKDLSYIAEIAEINPVKWVLYGGEDYQLLGTVSQDCLKKLETLQIPLKVIGTVIPANNEPTAYVKINEQVININQSSLDKCLFSHFK